MPKSDTDTADGKDRAKQMTEQPDEFLRIENIVLNGAAVNVIKDQSDHVAFPGYVPPGVDSPDAARSPQSDQTPVASDLHPPGSPKGKSRSDSVPTEKPQIPRSATGPLRPSVVKKWNTEMPGRLNGPRSRGLSFPYAPKRAGTSFAGGSLSQEHYNWEDEGFYSSSSSSSSDDEDDNDGPPVEGEEAPAKRQQKRRQVNENQRINVGNENYRTKGKLKKDGRLRITVTETAHKGYLAKALGQAAQRVVPMNEGEEAHPTHRQAPHSSQGDTAATITEDAYPKPRLNIVIMVIGSRGDAQPFLKIGKVLKEQYGHRVRIATHPAFRDFVENQSGLEFFSVGGDPSELMAFMVKNPGMIPTLEAVKAGDIGKRRAAMAEMFGGFWRACVDATDDEKDVRNLKMMGEKDPFVADAIIANPPSFAHIHCAEALGIPMHLMFTFPYTPTQAFPHPLASIKKSNVDPGYTNFISYPLVEMMVWQGLGDLVNEFRVKTLKLDPVSTLWAPGQSYRLHVPFSYLWSPGLVSKPEDWGDEIDVSGFVFLDLASSFTPSSELEQFLAAGEAPIYIGFGSIVVDDPDRFTQMIFEAVRLAGCRALLSKGWGGLGGEDTPENIFMLGNTPHDWLFPRVSACVIHGGAGTTAIALKCGKPTMVVPFFGDQHFWGSMLGSSGAGPEPIPYKNLSAEKLAESIKYCLTNEARSKAEEIARDIELEGDGAENAVRSFHRHLNLSGINSMRCSILHDHVACWQLKNSTVKLSPVAADMIVEKGLVTWRKLRLLRHTEWNDFEGPGEPFTGAASSIVNSVGNAFGGIGSVPYRMAKTTHRRAEKKKKKKKLREYRGQKRRAQHPEANANLHQHVETKDQEPSSASTEQNGTETRIEAPSEEKPADEQEEAEKEGQEKQPNGEPPAMNGTATRPAVQGRLTSTTMSSIGTGSTVDNPVEAYAEDVGTGFGKSAQAIAKAPVDLSMAVAQGFHNAPRLYGDDTVRRPPRVSGIRSGLKAAQFEFVYGMYDGATGLVRLPVRGARKDGVIGCLKGTGMGLTGFVLKPISAIVGPVGYTLKGVVKQAERDKQPDKIIRRARIAQGQRKVKQYDPKELKEVEKVVDHGWIIMKALWEALEEVEKKKGGIRDRLGARKKRALHAAFESVPIAEQALAAVRRGEDIRNVVGTEEELKKADTELLSRKTRASADGRKSLESSSRRQSKSTEQPRDPSDRVEKKNNKGPDRKMMSEKSSHDIPEESEAEDYFQDAVSEMPQLGQEKTAAA